MSYIETIKKDKEVPSFIMWRNNVEDDVADTLLSYDVSLFCNVSDDIIDIMRDATRETSGFCI